jgi:hypothetical protein
MFFAACLLQVFFLSSGHVTGCSIFKPKTIPSFIQRQDRYIFPNQPHQFLLSFSAGITEPNQL